MRQRGDNEFIDLLNHVRTAQLGEHDISILKSRFLTSNETPNDALHIFAENAPANIHNATMLNSISNELYRIQARDQLPKHVAQSKIEQALSRNQSETGGLATRF